VWPFGIVEWEVVSKTERCLLHCLVAHEEYVLVLHAPPQTFGEDVVHAATTTVHGDADATFGEEVGVFRTRVRRALVAVVNLGNSATSQCVVQRRSTERDIRMCGDREPNDVSARPVENGGKIRPTCP